MTAQDLSEDQILEFQKAVCVGSQMPALFLPQLDMPLRASR